MVYTSNPVMYSVNLNNASYTSAPSSSYAPARASGAPKGICRKTCIYGDCTCR